MASLPNVAIIELGSQYTLLIERTLREIGVRSVILEPRHARDWFAKHSVKAVILSGGAASVYDDDAPQPPIEVLSLRDGDGQPVPIFGICYGMQWLAHQSGGEVKAVLGNRFQALVSSCGSLEYLRRQRGSKSSVGQTHASGKFSWARTSMINMPKSLLPMWESERLG